MKPTPKYTNIQYAGKVYDFYYINTQTIGSQTFNLYRTKDRKHTLSESVLERLVKEQQRQKQMRGAR